MNENHRYLLEKENIQETEFVNEKERGEKLGYTEKREERQENETLPAYFFRAAGPTTRCSEKQEKKKQKKEEMIETEDGEDEKEEEK